MSGTEVQDDFADFVTLDTSAATLEDRLCGVARRFYEEATNRVGMAARVSANARAIKERQAEIQVQCKEAKAAGDKSMTEALIAALVERDEEVQELRQREIRLESAESLRAYRLEALRMLHASAVRMYEALGAERRKF